MAARGPMTNKLPTALFFLGVIPLFLFQFRDLAVAGGDSDWVVALVERPLYFFLRAPLVVAFHRGLWLLLRDWGWSAAECVSLSSSLAGGVFFWGLYSLSRDWRVWVPMMASCLPLLFIGHRETYPWPYALSVWTVVFLRGHLRGQIGPFPLHGTLSIAALAHPMTFMLWPGVLWATRPWSRERLQPFLITSVLVLALFVLLLSFGNAGGFPQRKWVLPVFEVGETMTRYPLFSWIHWRELGWFYLISMPLGAILAARWGLREWRGWLGGLNVVVVTTMLWSVIWHPGMSYSDWDLFAWSGMFMNLAGGLAWGQKAMTPPDEASGGADDS